MTKRFWAGVIAAAVISVLGIAVVAFLLNARVPATSEGGAPSTDAGSPPPVGTQSDAEIILGKARDFLSLSAEGEVIPACLMVIDNGGFTNPCVTDLSDRADYKALRRLDPELEVTGFDRRGDVATITGKHIRPAPSVEVSIQMILTERGEWKVRKLNGRPITFEGDFTPR